MKENQSDMESSKVLLTNIQRFSLHDGPGIRTTVFLKGCSLRCPWCSNPENQIASPQEYLKDGVKGTYGTYYTASELVEECLKDKAYYSGKISFQDYTRIRKATDIESLPGGVTFSGGEALLQMDKLVPVCERLHKEEVHIAVETCLFVPSEMIEIALKYIDLFYIDMKILDPNKCREIEKGDIGLYLSNLRIVMDSGVPVIIRVPVIGERTDDIENRVAVKQLLEEFRPLKIELIKEHNLGESKYKSLGLAINYRGVDDLLIEQYRTELETLGIPVEICRI